VIYLFIFSTHVFFLCECFFCRTFFPAVCQTLCASNTKPDIKAAATDTLRAIQRYSSEYIGNWADTQAQKDELKRLLV
jgi:hypothetical protein